jgi:starch phosphorylase
MSENQVTIFHGHTLEVERISLSKDAIKRAFIDNLYYIQGKFPILATRNDYYQALAYTIRDRLLHRWNSTAETYTRKGSRTVAYLSAEYLLGPHLVNNMLNLGICDKVRQAINELGLNFDEICNHEPEPGLGNGGLGRLAACFLDSMATMEIPSIGYGIRYQFGIFTQKIQHEQQIEITDDWLHQGNPWELIRPEWAVRVKLGGHVQHYTDQQGCHRAKWHPAWTLKGTPYDTPILGYLNNTANTLRLWQAESPEAFDLETFNRGDYWGAVNDKIASENITKILYPNDEQLQGKELRLQQQYFFVSCSLNDMIRIMQVQGIELTSFHEKFAIQLNDTHPAIAVPELMRLLVDEHNLQWETAWQITRLTFSYTNHTLLPEALEQWSLELFSRILPRHLEIIYEINSRFLDQVRSHFLGKSEPIAKLSLISHIGEEHYVRMAMLACVGSHTINGVAALHTELLKKDVLADYNAYEPGKICNKTNGVTPRRWLLQSNPRLGHLLFDSIGDKWVCELEELHKLEPLANDASFRSEWRYVKRAIKEDFSIYVKRTTGIQIDPRSLFDVQVKRIHEYKRQHLNILHIISLYIRLKQSPNLSLAPRTFIFGGKAAPGYYMAKLIIHLILSVAKVINRDKDVKDLLKVIFIPNFNVSTGQRIYPAADLSEQISTAGKEASGTGNMKFCMNGALTIGTLDGANIEIREKVGKDNFFLFGLNADEIQMIRPNYSPIDIYHSNPLLKNALDLIKEGFFSHGDQEVFKPLIDDLLTNDPYMVLADFDAYVQCQEQVDNVYHHVDQWARMSILNTARSGYFSSDRTIQEYCDDIWKVKPVSVKLLTDHTSLYHQTEPSET